MGSDKQRTPLNKRILLINSISSTVARVINLTVLVWLQRYLLQRIATEEYALYPVVTAIMMFVYTIRLVFISGVSRYTTAAYAKGDDEAVTRITSSMFVVTAAIALVIATAGGIAAWNGERLLTVSADLAFDARVMLGLMVFSTAVQIGAAPFEVGLYARQRFVLINAVELLSTLLRLSLLFVLLFGVSTRVLWVSVATEAANLSNLALRVFFSHRAIPAIRLHWQAISRSTTALVGAYGSWALLSQVAYRIMTSAAPIILNKLATPLDVTCYHLGNLLHIHLHSFIQTVAQPLVPALTGLHAVGDRARVATAYVRYGRYYSWAFFMAAVPIIILRRELVTLYLGEGYLLAATVILLLVSDSVLCLSNYLLYALAVATGQMRSLAVRAIIMQTVNLGLTLYVVGSLGMGAVGAALSVFAVRQVSAVLLEIPLGLRLAGVPLGRWLRESVVPGYLPGCVAAAVLWGIRALAHPASLVELSASVTVAALVYLVVLGGVCLADEDRRDLAAAARRVLSRRKGALAKGWE